MHSAWANRHVPALLTSGRHSGGCRNKVGTWGGFKGVHAVHAVVGRGVLSKLSFE